MLKRQTDRLLVPVDGQKICAFAGAYSFRWVLVFRKWGSPSSCVIASDRVFYLDDLRTIAASIFYSILVEASS